MKNIGKIIGWGVVLLLVGGVIAAPTQDTENISPPTATEINTGTQYESAVNGSSVGGQTTQPTELEASTPDADALSNDNYYTNTYGNEVHSPAYSAEGSVPEGATAQCEDGTYSFSQSRRGTCSHHGGVARWL